MQFINEAIRNSAEKIIKAKSQGESILDILARIYADRLPDKTLAQGKIMGQAVIQEVHDFDADYKTAQADQDKFISDALMRMNAGKNCPERCTFWLKISEVISSVSSLKEESDKQKILDDIQKLSVGFDEATPELEQELMNKAAESIKNSPIMLSAFTKHVEELETLQDVDDTAKLFINIGSDEVEYRSIVSMLVYTSCKNGEFEDIPADLTVQQITATVCAEFEQIKISEAVQNGSLAVDIASTLLFILGSVVLIHLMINVTLIAALLIGNYYGALLAIPAGLMLGFGTLRILTNALKAWAEDSKEIVNGVFAGISFIISGMKTLAGFIFGKLLPKFQNQTTSNTNQIRNVSFA